jgi:hypothetical protein
MHTAMKRGRWAVLVVLAVTVTGFATPADAATGPTATVSQGTLTVDGTAERDVLTVRVAADRVTVDVGFDGTVDAEFPRADVQRVVVLGNGGDDGMSVFGTGPLPVTVNGGLGNDFVGVQGDFFSTGAGDALTTLVGEDGNDVLASSTPGPATIDGGPGDDVADGGGSGIARESISMGDGDDVVQITLDRDNGEVDDTLDAGAGQDALEISGTFASESMLLSATGGHLVVDHAFRNRVDADNVEDVSYFGFGGLDISGSGDAVAVNDLSTTDVVRFTPNFGATGKGSTAPNNSSDTLTVRGTDRRDRIVVKGSGSNVTVNGLVPIVNAEFLAPDDFLNIDTLKGKDIVDSSALAPGTVQLIVR